MADPARRRYDTRHGVLILFSHETYNNLYLIASQLKRLFDPMTIGISPPGVRSRPHCFPTARSGI